MKFLTSSLCERLGQYRNIIIYGTGCYAQEIYPHLIQGGLKEKIRYFTQTDACENDLYENIPVISIDRLSCDKADCVILIATSELYSEEIKEKLSEYQYPNIVLLNDYVVDYVKNTQKFYSLHTYGEYCEAIADWYLRTHTNQTDKDFLVQKLINRGKNAGKNKDLNLIVAINGHITIRGNKIIGALKRKGYEIIMLVYCPNDHTWSLENFRKIGVTVYECQYIEEMLYMALQYDPLIYFFEPRWGDCTWVNIMLKNKKYFGKVVLSLYDTLNDGFFGQSQSMCDIEKYALENADGIVWKWFSEESMRKRGFCFQGKSILFLEYCSDVEEDLLNTSRAEDDILKLCMIVGIDNLYYEKRMDKTEYTCVARAYEIMEKIKDRDDCVFHMYIGRTSEEGRELYKQYENQYRNFKVYYSVERDQLLNRLRNYDYACNIYVAGEIPPDDLRIDNMTGNCMKNYSRNSFFDYLSAGLPMIATMPLQYIEYMQKYNVIVKMNLADLDIDYLKRYRQYYREKAEIARKELVIDNQIERLIEFFREVSYA